MSSTTACRVRSTSVNPNAASRAVGRLGRERRGARGRERLEQRSEPDAFVNGPHRCLVPGEVGVELIDRRRERCAPVAHDPAQPLPGVVVGGHGVHLLLVDELQPVLDGPQEPVGLGELVGVGPPDVAGVGQLGEGGQRVRGPERGIERSVHELEQLHGELDVADAASPALDLTVAESPSGDLALGPRLHGPDGVEVVGREAAGPQPIGRRPVERLADLGHAGHGARLEQGLELPRLRPPVPVGLERSHRPHERAVATLRTQVEVDPEALAGHGGDGPGGPVVGRAGEDDVDVARIVELAAAELAHADHGQLGRAGQAP